MKFSLSPKLKRRMRKAISMSKKLNRECGFSFCDNEPSSEIVCEGESWVNFPSCKKGGLRGSFHVHTRKEPLSEVDIISAIATGNDIECLGYPDDEIKCFDMAKHLMGERAKEIKKRYKEVVESTNSPLEVQNKLFDLEPEVRRIRSELKNLYIV